MTDRAAIMGSLVDVRNIGVHKSVKLTIHVPEELAETVINAFGWPTGVNPVAVAIARLSPEAKEPEPVSVEPLPARARNSWDELPPSQQAAMRCNEPVGWHPSQSNPPVRARNSDKRLVSQAGIACNDPVFQRFLLEQQMVKDMSADQASIAVRLICGVQSRKDLLPDTPAGNEWQELYGKFLAWKEAA